MLEAVRGHANVCSHSDAGILGRVAFVIFLGILGYAGVHKTALQALDRHAAAIKAELDEARRLREEAAKLFAEYQRKQSKAEREAAAIVSEAKADTNGSRPRRAPSWKKSFSAAPSWPRPRSAGPRRRRSPTCRPPRPMLPSPQPNSILREPQRRQVGTI